MYKITNSAAFIIICSYYYSGIEIKDYSLLSYSTVNRTMDAVNILFSFIHKEQYFFEFCSNLNKFDNTNLPAFKLRSNIANYSLFFGAITFIGYIFYTTFNIWQLVNIIQIGGFVSEYMRNISYVIICDLYQNRMKSLRRMLITDFAKSETTDANLVHTVQYFKNKFIELTRCMNLLKNPQYTILVNMLK